jgi:UDP-glucose 4-epimerase
MTVLITGGTGANGALIVQEFVKRGETPVVFDVAPRPAILGETAHKVKIIRGDITDFYQLLNVVKKEDVDRIIHTAWYWTKPIYGKDPATDFKVNLLGTFNVLEAARILGVKKVVFTSSWQMFSSVSKIPMPEDYPKTPRNTYGAGKLAMEMWGESYADNYGLDFIGLRFPSIYGLRPIETLPDKTHAYVEWMVVNSIRREPIRIVAGDTKQQMLYLKDLANAVILASMCEKPKHRIFNIGTDEYFSVKEIADLIQRLIPSANIEIMTPDEKIPPENRGLDYQRAKEELNYVPQYTMESGLKDYIEWVKSNPQAEDLSYYKTYSEQL